MSEKTRDELVKEMNERIQNGGMQIMQEIAMPGVDTSIPKDANRPN